MKWMMELPTEPGWYWFREEKQDDKIVLIRKDGAGELRFCDGRLPSKLADWPGEWAGMMDATSKAEELIRDGYYQVGRRFRDVACLPAGKSAVEALGEASGRPEWAALLGETAAADHFLRVCGTARCPSWARPWPSRARMKYVGLDEDVFLEFRRLGGRTARDGLRSV
ncbi:MAG: hypothetical protein DRQ14_09075 [Candidatus Latescibacterota bacterium]|nr:MAG: hypothetical protein DRQ14_09075 [Candidatus Latescibacterota bacterium]